MAAGKDQPLKELQPHLDSLEVGQEAEGEGEDGQVVVGQVQPLHELQPHHIVWQGADLVVAQVQGPSHKRKLLIQSWIIYFGPSQKKSYEKVINIQSWIIYFHRFQHIMLKIIT
jgi:hypothetical protein